jgi:hypothetical protein
VLAIGILGLAAGHYYSWRRRDNVSTRRTLILFFFMLILTIYLGQEMLLYGAGDRVLLARYLIYGLALGSFDLMRKRNLLASLILGALLLMIISEIALNLWFLVFRMPGLHNICLTALNHLLPAHAKGDQQPGSPGELAAQSP